MGFDVAAARKEGYSDSEIADYLAGQNKFDVAGARNEGYSDDEIIGHLTTQRRGLIERGIDAVTPADKSVMDGRENAQPANDGGVQVDATGRISTVSDRAMDIGVNRAIAPKGGEQDAMAEASKFLQGSTSPRIADQEAVTLKPERAQADAVEAVGRKEQAEAIKSAEASSGIQKLRRETAEESPYGAAGISGLSRIASNIADVPQFLNDAVKLTVINPILKMAGQEGMSPTARFQIAQDLEQAANDFSPKVKDIQDVDLTDPKDFGRWAGINALQQAPQIAMGSAAAFIPKLRSAYLGLMGAMTAAGEHQRNLDNDVDFDASMMDSTTKGAFEVIGESLGFNVYDKIGGAISKMAIGQRAQVAQEMLKRVMVGAGALAGQAASGAVEEGITQVGQNASSRYVLGDKNVNLTDGLVNAMAVGALIEAPTGLSLAARAASIPTSRYDGASDPITRELDTLPASPVDAELEKFAQEVGGGLNAADLLAEDAPATGLISQSNAIGATQGQSPVSVNPGASYDASAIPLTAPATPLQESAPAPVTPSEAVNARSAEPVHGGLDTLRAESGNSKPVGSDATGLLGHDDRPTAGERAARTDGAAEPVSGAGQDQPVSDAGNAAVERSNTLAKDTSWVIRNKDTGEVIMETFDKAKVDALNTAKYEAVPILNYLASLNANQQPTKEPSNAQAPQAVESQTQQPAQESAQIANQPAISAEIPQKAELKDNSEAIKPLINQLTNFKKTVDEIKYQTGISVKAFTSLIDKAKDGTGKASDFTKMAGRFKGKDANINMALLSLADALKPAQTEKKAQKPSSDLLTRIKQLGGISSTHALDVTGEARAPGAWRFAFKRGGRGLDDLAISLAGEGFNIDLNSPHDNGGVRQLAHMIKAHIGGERNFKAATQEAQAAGILNSREYDAMVEHAEALGIKWQGLSEQQLEDAIYEAEDAIAMAKLDEAEAEVSDAVVEGFADEADLEFTQSTPDAVAEWMGVGNEQGRNQEEVSGAAKGESAPRAGSDSRTAQEAQGVEGEVQRPEYALEGQTADEVNDGIAAQAAQERAQQAEAANVAEEARKASDEAVKANNARNGNAAAAFTLGATEPVSKAHQKALDKKKAEAELHGQDDLLSQPAKPTAESKISELVSGALAHKDGNKLFADFGDVAPEVAEKVELITHQNVAGWKHGIDESAIRHVLNEHGSQEAEAARGQIAITAKDFELLPKIVSNPDDVSVGDEPGMVKFTKKIGDTFYVVKELRTGRKKLMVKTMWKAPAVPDAPVLQSSAETPEAFGKQPPHDNSNVLQPAAESKPAEKDPMTQMAESVSSLAKSVEALVKKDEVLKPESPKERMDRLLREAGVNPDEPADKATSLRRKAEKLMEESSAMLDGMQPGQPVLSTRDRNLREKSIEKARKASELYAEAEALEAAKPSHPAQTEQQASGKVDYADRIHTLDVQSDLFKRVHEGKVSADEFKAAFDALLKNKSGIVSDLEAMTKAEIFKQFTGLEYRYKNEKKDRLIDAAYRSMLDDFVLGDSISYSMGQKYEDVIRGYVDRTTDESLSEFADKIRKGREEREAHRKDALAGMENPQTLDDYKRILAAKAQELGEGATFSEARMAMTPEQRAKFDELAAEKSRDERRARADQQKTEVRVAAQTTTGQVIETKHTKTGEPLFVVKAAERVERDIYNQWNATAKRLGGWYSSFNGRGAVPGFQFKARENADAFLQYLGGNVEQAKQVAEERRNAFADDKSQTAVERLNEMASNLEEKADASLNQERKANTARRARFAAAAEAEASHDKAMAITMRNIASAIENGTAKFLDRVRQKVQVEMLSGFVRTAQDDMHRKLYPTYAEQERHKGEKPTPEVADYATFPNYTAFRSDLASLGRALLEVEGTVKLGQRLMKVADDVTDTYLAFAKENLHKVSRFSVKDSSAPAVFPSKTEAEAVIARSGFNGKAIVLPFKRGQNIIILSPSEAMKHGIWQGDNDKRITLSPEFGGEIVEKLGKLSWSNAATVRNAYTHIPWQFESAYEKRKRLEAMGIETPAELRAALREFISLKEAPKEADKIKQMERAMIGRRNDGLDFFPTPDSVADEMVEAADIKEGMSVLEPSAGMGHIAERIREAGVDPDVVELSGDRRELLEAKGFRLVGHDFMDMNPRGFTYGDVFRDKDGVEGIMRGSGGMGSDRVGFIPLGKDERQSEWRDRDELTGVRKNGHNSGYDRILMNPPFSDGRAAQHVQHAYELLKSGGRLVAIVDEGVFFRQDKKTQAFRDWLEQVGATDEKLADGTFLDPSLPVNTGVAARMLVIDKSENPSMLNLGRTPRVDSGSTRISLSDVRDVVGRISLSKKLWNVEIRVFDTFSALPNDVKDSIAKYGDSANPQGVTHGGIVYVIADQHHSAEEVEATILHEVEGHIGIQRLYGKGITSKLNDLYLAIGGMKGMRKIAAQRGITEDLAEYAKALGESEFTNELRTRIMMDEVLAHIAQEPRFTDRVKTIVGMIRAWLREHGFAKLAEYGETDLLNILREGRKQLKTVKTDAGDIALMQAAWHGIPTFYSQLRKAMRDAPDRVFSTGKQTAAWLQANAAKLGIKKDEMYWSGINDWLQTQGKVSKADVLAYLDGNGVQVQDVMLGEQPTEQGIASRKAVFDKYQPQIDSAYSRYVASLDGGNIAAKTDSYDEWMNLTEKRDREADAAYTLPEDRGTDKTKFATYQLPGGESYRELLLTLPVKHTVEFDPAKLEIKRIRQSVTQGSVDLIYDGKKIGGFANEGDAKNNWMKPESHWKDVARRLFYEGNRLPDGRMRYQPVSQATQFRSSHYGQPNILAHVRFNERTDAEGKRVLFLEEIQSDWGQKGKKEGFSNIDPAKPVVVFDARTGKNVIAFKTGAEAEAYIAGQDPKMSYLDYEDTTGRGMIEKGKVPSAPFVTDTKAWTALTLKRMIAYAAENGFDKVAWTTGEQQAARYDLSKQVKYIEWEKNGDGTYNINAPALNGEVIYKEDLSVSELEDTLGKDVAKKIADGVGDKQQQDGYRDWTRLSGENLSVGNQGMKGFYDAIVPQVANDILKKMGGGKVEKVSIETYAASQSPSGYQITEDQHGFTITPELRAKVLNEGLPLFSKRQANITGMTVAQVRVIVAPIAAKWTHGKLEIVQDASEVPEFAAAAADGGGAIEGAYLGNGRIYLVANSLQTEDRALQVLAHEAIGHLAAEELLDSGEYRAALKAVQLMDKTGNKIVRRLAEEVDSLQPGLSADRRAKEILAKAVETGEYKNNATLKRIIGDIVTWLKARLRDMGFNGKWLDNISEVEAFAALDRGALSSMREAEKRLYRKQVGVADQKSGGAMMASRAERRNGREAFYDHYEADVEAAGGMSGERIGTDSIQPTPATLPNVPDKDNVLQSDGLIKQQSLPIAAQPPAQPPRQNNLGLQGGQAGNNASWDAPEPSTLDNLIYKLQNKHIDMKRVVEAIKSTGAALGEKWNAYLQEELFHGRAAKRTQDFVNTELKPLMVEMQARGLTLAELDEYLHARHADEANALIAERDPDMPDGGSGMTNQEAADYFANLPDGKRKQLDAAARRVDAIIAKTRDLYVSYGLVSKNQADEWAAMFQHYVPLMREDHDGGMGIGQGFSIRGKEVKHRTGSTAAVVDIFANIALQREKAIVRGEKNRVAVSLAGMVKLNPNPDFWTFGKVPTERVLNEQTGLVEERADPMFKSRDNVVVAKIKDNKGDVHERAVIFNEHDERAMRMAEAIKNLDATQLGELLATSARITRYFSSINTQYNPVFGVTNLVRDTQGLLLNLSSTPIAKHRAEVLKNIPSALKGIYADTRAERKGHPATSKWAQLWEELQDEGGMTGYRDLYRTSEDRAKAIEHELDPHNWVNSKWGKVFTAGGMLKVPMTTAQDMAAPIFDWLSDYNLTMEGATRLSAYKVAIEQGMSKQAAASLAKNITVNFNRKGQMGQQAGALYAFFNAAMQGTARISETVFTMDKGDIKTLRLSKAGKAIVAGGVMLGVMQALALAAAGFDDDEPPEFLRERNLIMPIGGKKYISIPMPLGFHAIPNIGRIATEWAMHGFKHPAEHAIRMMSVFTEAFNPIGSSGISMQTIAPTALDPFAALAENKDWTGKPIAKEDFNSMNPTPGFTRNKDTATYLSKVIAEAINTVSGGTKYTPGMASPTADQIDYLFGQVTGGVGRELGKAEQTVMATMTGDELPTYKIPLVGRFYGDSETQYSQSNAFYANLKKINEVEAEIKGRLKDRQPVDEYKAENPEYRLIMRANYAEKIVSGLRKQKRELTEKGAPRERIKAIEDRITNEMKKLNEVVRMLREKEAA